MCLVRTSADPVLGSDTEADPESDLNDCGGGV